MKWEYYNDGAKKESFEKAMDKLSRFTGLRQELRRKWRGEDRMGYFGVQFYMSTEGTRLAALGKTRNFVGAKIPSVGRKLAHDFFEVHNDPSNLCSFGTWRDYECVEKYLDDTVDALTDLQEKVTRFSKGNWKNRDEAMQQLVDIGHLIFETPFTIQAILKEAPESFDLHYKLEGQKFRPVNLTSVNIR